MQTSPFSDWNAVQTSACSSLFAGHTLDAVADRNLGAALAPSGEALFIQSNARVLIGQAANGTLRLIALPTQVYPAPTGEGEFGLGPGMYHHFDAAMYAGDMHYLLQLEGRAAPVDLADDARDDRTAYADHFLPLTETSVDDLAVLLISFAPLAGDAQTAPLTPAPLPGPAGAFYCLRLRNTGSQMVRGKVLLRAGDMLVGHYEDAAPEMRSAARPQVSLRQQTLILSRPEGAVGVHLHAGRWVKLEAPFQAERDFSLAPGAEIVIETSLAVAAQTSGVMREIYELYRRPVLDWLNLTAGYWRSRLGELAVDADGSSEEALFSRDIFIRSLFDNFNCLQTDAQGNLIAHWQGAPSHGYGTVWGIDVEPTAISAGLLCPEIMRQACLFFMTRSRAPKGPKDHSVPILVAPIIIAKQWLQASGDVAFLKAHPQVEAALQSIIDDVCLLKAAGEALFPSRYSSDGPVGRRYDYGTNVKVRYAFESYAYLLRHLGRAEDAERYAQLARQIDASIARTMLIDGPFGRQLSGGTNLGEDPGTFYLPEGVLYYDGEDTSSMLAPLYGACDLADEAWLNYHRFARSMACANYDPEFDVLRWGPSENGVFDGTAFFSRLGGSHTRAEMIEALITLRKLGTDDVTGSAFWWPHGREYRRSLTRCSQGQGAWAWQYAEQWLGLKVDAPARELTFAPRGLLTQLSWRGYTAGGSRFDVQWHEGNNLKITNLNEDACTVRIGLRQPGAGAEGPLTWQTHPIAAGETLLLNLEAAVHAPGKGYLLRDMNVWAIRSWGDAQGVVFRRFGPAMLWGHWDVSLQWDSRAMPLALRFVILNGTTERWQDVRVQVHCPVGWVAQGRAAQHWPRPAALQPGEVTLALGELGPLERAVAPFWVRGPQGYEIHSGWSDATRPFHANSQPGPGLTIATPDVDVESEVLFGADLTAQSETGQRIARHLDIPVRLVPHR
jgi:hypothetical protein